MGRRIVVAGASGLIGSALRARLMADGDEVHLLVRRPATSSGETQWNPERGELPAESLRGADAVVSLNGASVGKLPWTRGYQRELRDSRLQPTRLIQATIEALGDDAPAHWVSASAVGYYGSQPGVVLDESGEAGDTFLAQLCVDWEAAASLPTSQTKRALIRTAPVIHEQGVLKPMIRLTSLGLGGRLGQGTQVWPWISLDDEVRAIRHIIDAQLEGPVNLTGPVAATASDIGAELANQMRRPYLVPAPEFALRWGLGDAAESLLLSDADVRPRALEDSGFTFHHETATQAIRAALA